MSGGAPRLWALALLTLAACGGGVIEEAPLALEQSPHAPQAAGPAATATSRHAPDAVLWVGGDVLVSDAMRDFARLEPDPARGFAKLLEPVARIWREPGAFVLVNLEMPVADTRRHALDAEPVNPHGLTAVHLQGPSWLPAGLAHAGVSGVTLANNHALDQDRDGLLETVHAARRAGLVVSGAGVYPEHRWPLRLGPEGREICVMNFYDGRGPGAHEPGEVARSVLDEQAFASVREAAGGCALVVVVHVLGELVARPKPAWRRWAARLVEAGASAIVVHGTHVVLSVERLGGVPIVWGLGNLVSDMGRLARPGDPLSAHPPKERAPATREALLARLRLDAVGHMELRLLAAWMSNDRIPRWRYGMPGGDAIHFALRPLSRCEPTLSLPGWPQAARRETEAWVSQRRDHILRVTGLAMDACAPDAVAWLRLR